jgi:hypothetical protein
VESPDRIIISISLLSFAVGCIGLWASDTYALAVAGLIFCGAGLAAGFPMMLGILGNTYSSLSGTAFGLVLTIALLGNMLIITSWGFSLPGMALNTL